MKVVCISADPVDLPMELSVQIDTPEELADLYGRLNAFAPEVFQASLDHEGISASPTWCESEKLLEVLDEFIQEWAMEVR